MGMTVKQTVKINVFNLFDVSAESVIRRGREANQSVNQCTATDY